jgi:hypothetical protein
MTPVVDDGCVVMAGATPLTPWLPGVGTAANQAMGSLP